MTHSRSIPKIPRWPVNLLLLVLLLLPGLAQAERENDDTRFRQHYEHGLHLYSDEEYEDSIKEFQVAYSIRSSPRLLFNLGQAHRNLGHAKEALRFYQLYQAMEPNPKPGLKAELDGYISQLQDAIRKAERARQFEEQRNQPVLRPDLMAAAVVPPVPQPHAGAPAPALSLRTQLSLVQSTRVYKRWWFWTAIGGAVLTAVVAGAAAGATRNRFGGPVDRPTF